MIFFTADTHFGHNNIIRHCDRPFLNTHDMDKTLIQNWNSVVSRSDTVFHLGDVGIKDIRPCVWQLNGYIILIRGNHDRAKYDEIFREVCDVRQIEGNGKPIWLSHYAHRVWPRKNHGGIHLFGHSHGKLEAQGKSMDVGVDSNNYTPISMDYVLQLMEQEES